MDEIFGIVLRMIGIPTMEEFRERFVLSCVMYLVIGVCAIVGMMIMAVVIMRS